MVSDVVPAGAVPPKELLRLAGSVEQMSVHSLAEAIAHAARIGHDDLAIPTEVVEMPGRGIAGSVDGHRVQVGSGAYLAFAGIDSATLDQQPGVARAHVAVDGLYAGWIQLADTVREDAHQLSAMLRRAGVSRVAMATGDHAQAAHEVGRQLGIAEVHSVCTAEDKLALLQQMQRDSNGLSVVLVGDGINDAPALAAADVGIAMGSAGATAASEAAEAVVISGRVSGVADAIAIGKRSTRIARQSIIAGMALSSAGMVVAAAGYLAPVFGALAQEAIDLAVILNALRALALPALAGPGR
jgi:cation transport ATPase